MTLEEQVTNLRDELHLLRAENEELHTFLSRYLGSMLEKLVTHAGLSMDAPLDERGEMFKAILQSDPTFVENL